MSATCPWWGLAAGPRYRVDLLTVPFWEPCWVQRRCRGVCRSESEWARLCHAAFQLQQQLFHDTPLILIFSSPYRFSIPIITMLPRRRESKFALASWLTGYLTKPDILSWFLPCSTVTSLSSAAAALCLCYQQLSHRFRVDLAISGGHSRAAGATAVSPGWSLQLCPCALGCRVRPRGRTAVLTHHLPPGDKPQVSGWTCTLRRQNLLSSL